MILLKDITKTNSLLCVLVRHKHIPSVFYFLTSFSLTSLIKNIFFPTQQSGPMYTSNPLLISSTMGSWLISLQTLHLHKWWFSVQWFSECFDSWTVWARIVLWTSLTDLLKRSDWKEWQFFYYYAIMRYAWQYINTVCKREEQYRSDYRTLWDTSAQTHGRVNRLMCWCLFWRYSVRK